MIKKTQLVEVCSSYSQKVGLQRFGGSQYENIDFFQSAKAEVPYSQFEKVAKELYEKCKKIVETRIAEYQGAKEKIEQPSELKQAMEKPFPKKEEAEAIQGKVEQLIEEAETDEDKKLRQEREEQFFNLPPANETN